MRLNRLVSALAAALAAVLGSGFVQAAKPETEPKWDVNAAHGETKQVGFSTREGTWMSVDVSPDGQQLVFDLLGDLYLMSMTGGEAKRITHGLAFDVQPRFSPDGREVSFTSDRGGGNNIWRMPLADGEPVAVTNEDFRLTNNAEWTPDGDYLIARKHFTGERSLGAGELWLYHRSGGSGLQLTQQKNDQQDLGEPAISPDGRYVYYSEDITAGPLFQYNKNPHDGIYAIKRLDRQTGETEVLLSGAGGAVRPQPSPDGKSLAFVRRVREKSVLHVMDLESGDVRPVWDGLNHDQQEAWAIFGPYPGFDWTPDSSQVVIWAQGGLWKIHVASGEAERIDFTAQVDQTVTAPLRFARTLPEGSFTPKMVRDVATSPDGQTVIFHAAGKLYRRSLPDGQPQRLTIDTGYFEYQPSFSPDGQTLLYTRWADDSLVQVMALNLLTGERRQLNAQPGFLLQPAFLARCQQGRVCTFGG